MTMIDEPEVSLHPELLSLLVDLLREASQRTQLIVATHADRLVKFLQPAEVVTIDVNAKGPLNLRGQMNWISINGSRSTLWTMSGEWDGWGRGRENRDPRRGKN